MKKLLLSAGLFVVSAAGFAQLPKVQAPTKTSIQAQSEAQKEIIYKQLIGKDIAAGMKAFNIKDTIGKTSTALIPQIEKGTRFLLLALPNGDKIAYKDNKLAGIVYKQ